MAAFLLALAKANPSDASDVSDVSNVRYSDRKDICTHAVYNLCLVVIAKHTSQRLETHLLPSHMLGSA